MNYIINMVDTTSPPHQHNEYEIIIYTKGQGISCAAEEISVTEQGTKAGAATAVEMVAEGAAEIQEYREVVLDRPFIYMLIDCETNLPFFIGTMMDVNGD
jgi:serine protease inhibitor